MQNVHLANLDGKSVQIFRLLARLQYSHDILLVWYTQLRILQYYKYYLV